MIKFLLILVVFLAGFQSYAEVAIADVNVNSKDTLKTEAAKPAVQLVKTFSKRDVRGILIDAITENPTEKVNVILKSKISNKSFEAESDDDGIFLFKNIPVGEYQLLIEDKDYILPGDPEKTASKRGFPVSIDNEHETAYNMQPFKVSLKVSWMFNWGDKGTKEHYWSHLTAKIILIIYGSCLVLVFFYSILQLSLSIAYARNRKKKEVEFRPTFDPAKAPKVTVQLPMYNELYVAERIIEKAAAFDYPADKLEIQVLDDSTDETKDVIAKKVAEVAATGVNIKHIHRVDRTGYKAGALDAAMDKVEGEFIAIFDADFEPEPDFLQKTMPYFEDEKIGVVQTRWGHINKTYSVLTQLQAFGLNGHFAVEQGGRTASGHFINFNGKGGIWRKKCIEDAGGWEHDTLTEDLDLSYRAQL